jgi:hypothetical protein
MQEMENISKELPKAVAEELNKVWMKIWEDAIDRCPKKTGALAASINVIEGAIGLIGAGLTMNPRSTIGQFIFDRTLTAGDVTVINPETKKPTSEYAQWVHEGHIMRDGHMWEGVPFLTEALKAHEAELESAIAKALKELKANQKE